MVTVDVTSVITDFNGNSIPVSDGKGEKKDLVLRDVLVNSLMAIDPKQQIKGTEKIRRYKIASKVSERDEVEFKAEDIVLIKKSVEKAYAPLVMGRVFEMVCPEELKEEVNE